MKNLDIIQEMSYLSTGNTPQYRRIMRIFFQEYERMHFQLDKEEIYQILKAYPEFETYTIEQLKTDLNKLVEWKNLTAIQDPKKVYTIADYKNKQFRYSMTEYAVEIERLTVKLENLFLEGGNLSSSYFIRIEEALSKLDEMREVPVKELNEWWRNLQEDFKRLNQNYQDYLREFYSGKADKLLKSVEFILHKDRFITYLKEFIQELQENAGKIEWLLRQTKEETENQLLERVIQSELDIPHPAMEGKEWMEESIRENVYGKWKALKRWFLPTEGNQSEYSHVLDITDEIIRKIIQNAALIVQLHHWGISRKDDYKKILSLFMDCTELREAHKLAAHVFGIQHIRHYKVNQDRSTDSMNSSTYEEEPVIFSLKPRTRSFQPRVDKSGFETKAAEKLAQRNKYLKQREEEQKMVLKYMRGNRLDLSQIDDCVTVNMRETLLRWITAANLTRSGKGRTEYGQVYHLIRTQKRCTLKCEDGDLVMPAYVFDFTEDKDGSSSGLAGELLDSER